MRLSNLERLGEWNPQLFREIKGRLKTRNVAIAAAISVFGQLLVYLYYQTLLPASQAFNRYCIGNSPPNSDNYIPYSLKSNNYCLQDALGNLVINRSLWWLDLFACLSIIGTFALLVVGTHMLISDLSQEERQGTLALIRLSPQSAISILTGKMLGVPVLLYLVGILALPLHLRAGLAAQIPLSLILSFYGVLIASCVFFYSGALLYGLVSAGLGGFQAWLGSGAILCFSFLMTSISFTNEAVLYNSVDWFTLFYPAKVLPYLVDSTPHSPGYFELESLVGQKFYGLPLWRSAWSAIGLMLLNCVWWTYLVWQGLRRRFHNPSTTILSKQQSYRVSASFVVMMLGFSLQAYSGRGNQEYTLFTNFAFLLGFNLLLFLGLIAALSPHRQALQDWARYRHQATTSESQSIVKDLISGAKSPSIVSIALNLAITSAILLPSILLLPLKQYKIPLLLALLLSASLIMIYASLAQLMLLMKTQKRAIWATGGVVCLIILPLASFAFFRLDPAEIPGLWLFSAVPVAAIKHATTTHVFLSLLAQWLAIALLSFQMKRQLQKAGQSTTKALSSGRLPLA
ncbi:hypothetical protein [Lyngbya aestuarii]|uniref:hypothetical protein n=1 Tax=Lyngbya aestuarii TaxID=118322 RepID=UPI00403D7369